MHSPNKNNDNIHHQHETSLPHDVDLNINNTERSFYLSRRLFFLSAGILSFITLSIFSTYYYFIYPTISIGLVANINRCEKDESTSKIDQLITRLVHDVNAVTPNHFAVLANIASYKIDECSDSLDKDFLSTYTGLSKITSQISYVLGNHDISSDYKSVDSWLSRTKNNNPYYSFDYRDFHIIVLDTVLGGEPMRKECEEEPLCSEQKQKYLFFKSLLDGDKKILEEYLDEHKTTTTILNEKKRHFKKLYEDQDKQIRETRSYGQRDRGRVSFSEIDWLKSDIESTRKLKIIILSEHPLFYYIADKKTFDIDNREDLHNLLVASTKSGRNIVAISGEEGPAITTILDGIHYYVISGFSTTLPHTWFLFEWDLDGPKITQRPL